MLMSMEGRSLRNPMRGAQEPPHFGEVEDGPHDDQRVFEEDATV
jgi:hypothetical protein